MGRRHLGRHGSYVDTTTLAPQGFDKQTATIARAVAGTFSTVKAKDAIRVMRVICHVARLVWHAGVGPMEGWCLGFRRRGPAGGIGRRLVLEFRRRRATYKDVGERSHSFLPLPRNLLQSLLLFFTDSNAAIKSSSGKFPTTYTWRVRESHS